MSNRAVITSFGIISSLGCDESEILDSFINKRTSFKKSEYDESVSVSPVNNFALKDYTGQFKERRYLTRGVSFALASSISAFKRSGLKECDLAESGLLVGTGPNLDITSDFRDVADGVPDMANLNALWILKYLPNTAASSIAKYLKIHGENITVGTACAASLQAIGEGYRKVRDGYCDIVFAGGGDSRISPGGILSYKMANALNTATEVPDLSSMPFDLNRKGFVPGEGGAFVVIESLEHAEKRNAEIIAEISGFGSSMDGHAMTDPDPAGVKGELAVRKALAEASLDPGDIDFISAHGTGTAMNDSMESGIIKRVYGNSSPAIGAFKSWIGHCASACGAMELVLSLICMKNDFFPEIRNLSSPVDNDLNFLLNGGSHSFGKIALENFGFGGQNCSLVIKKYDKK